LWLQLGDNLQFVQMVARAGGSAQLEVYDGMWHDFEMSSEGCGSGKNLAEGVNAIERAGAFLKRGKGAHSLRPYCFIRLHCSRTSILLLCSNILNLRSFFMLICLDREALVQGGVR